MKAQRLLIALTILNIAVLTFSVIRSVMAAGDGTATVLRGRALQIVDDQGRVRASLAVYPADPTFKMPDGTTGHGESVLLRLITAEGRPNVKLGAGADGAGLVLGGESNPTHVQILAQRGSTLLKLSNKDGREQIIKP